MEFCKKYLFAHDCYYIEMYQKSFLYYTGSGIVEGINHYIPITIDEYINMLQNNGATLLNDEYYFKNEEDADRVIDILTTNYAVIIKLMEKFS